MKTLILIILFTSLAGAQKLYFSDEDELATVDTGAGLLDSLKAYWAMEDANDSYGSNNLTNLAVSFVAGKVNNAGSFDPASNSRMTLADNADISMPNTDFTIALWVKANTLSTLFMGIFNKSGTSGSREYSVYFYQSSTPPNTFNFDLSSNGTAYVSLTNGMSVLINTWYFIVAWYDLSESTMYIQVDNGTVYSAAQTGGAIDGVQDLILGRHVGSASFEWDGLMDEIGLWKRTLTAGERTYLYNNGSGRTYTGGKIQ